MKFRDIVAPLILGLALIPNSPSPTFAGNLVVNGDFEGPFGDPNYRLKERFSEIKPVGWSGGDKLTYLSAPGFATVQDTNGGLAVWAAPGDTSPNGGRFVMADGDPAYSDTFYQTLENLTIGQTYAVSFYQAAGQNSDRIGPTWEQWKVGFGDQYQYSNRMETPAQGFYPWESQILFFVASAVSAKLSFLAIGGPGTGPVYGLPPVLFLDGVDVQHVPDPGPAAQVPEPTSLILSSLGIVGMYGIRYWRRRTTRLA